MRTFTFDMYQTLMIAVLALLLGRLIRKKFPVFKKFCIPAPVIGGLIVSVITCIFYATGILTIAFDDSFREICMIFFFTSVGFQANLKALKAGGKGIVILLVLLVCLITSQNLIAIGLSKPLGISPLTAFCTGSIPMVGGHGTAGAFGPVLEDFGVTGASTICTAAATYGLIVGSLIGGPLADRLIRKRDLIKTAVSPEEGGTEEKSVKKLAGGYAGAVFILVIAVGLGTVVTMLLRQTGLTFPVYIGAMIIAAVIRNIGEYTGKIPLFKDKVQDIGSIMLSLFLGVAMITLRIWELASLALPMIILLLAQTFWMLFYAGIIVFRAMGKNYDSAVITAGFCGFGMGATPNAMANMQAVTARYVPSAKAFLLIPIVGSLFSDFLNSIIITFFLNVA